MSAFQWLLIAPTTGVGGSLLTIGSAAGVALMGQSNRTYSFAGHLRWSWAILLGYAASVDTHLLLNGVQQAVPATPTHGARRWRGTKLCRSCLLQVTIILFSFPRSLF